MQQHRHHTEDYTRITDKTVIIDALDRILISSEFKGSNRSKQLLQYIVDKHLSGEAKQINGTTIAQDVLGAGIDFDPSTNPIVRVQAGRLRKLLAEYYRRSGKNEAVLIFIAKGQYAPQFGTLSDFKPNNAVPAKTSFHTIAKLLIAACLGGVIFMSWYYIQKNKISPLPQISVEQNITPAYPRIAITPFHNLTNDPNNDIYEQGFQHQLATDLYQFHVVKIIISDLDTAGIMNAQPLTADYLLEGTFLSVSDDIDLIVKLIDIKSASTVKQYRITRKLGDDSYFNALVDISSDLSEKFAGQEGALVKQSLNAIKNKLDVDLKNYRHMNLKAFECLALFHKFEASKTIENFNHANGCLKHQISLNPEDSTLLASLSWITVYGAPESGLFEAGKLQGDYSLEKALQLAMQAVAYHPGNSRAYEFMALIQWKMQRRDAAIQSMRRSISLNPSATANLANLGSFLSFNGNWTDGLEATHTAIAQNEDQPYWYYTPLFIRAVLDKNGQEAMLYAKKHHDDSGADYGAYTLIAASLLSDEETIRTYIPIIKAAAVQHNNDPLFATRRWVQSPKIIEVLESELKAVGISIP